MPTSDQSMMIVQVKMPVGTSLKETNMAVSLLEEKIVGLDSLISATTFVGLSEGTSQGVALGFGGGGVNEAQIMMRLKDKKDRQMSSVQIQEYIRKNTPKIKGMEVSFMDMSAIMMGGGNAPVVINVFGKDLTKLKEITDGIAQKIATIEGVRDVDTTLSQSKPELVIKIDREKASHLGLTIGQIGSTVRSSMQGVVATQLRQGGEETDIRVRYDEVYRDNLERVKNLTIVLPTGMMIPLKQVAFIDKAEGPVKIDRDDRSRVVAVTANVLDRDVGSVIGDIKEELKNEQFPAGYFIKYAGSYEQMQDTFKTLGLALLLAILLVYMIMASQFESLVDPFVVMFELPLAFIGVSIALLITRQNLSLPSIMGVIMLSGIVVNNAIVLIDYVNQLRKRGIEKHEALIQAGLTRLRPILITSATTVLAMIPMALAKGEGSEMMRPMAIAVIGGLTMATILTLIVMPVIYSIVERISYYTEKHVSNIINGD